jgi:hypothetical protein
MRLFVETVAVVLSDIDSMVMFELKLDKRPKAEAPPGPVGEALGSEASDFMMNANALGGKHGVASGPANEPL